MESPGTAPGSEPRITGAFIAIFLVSQNIPNIGAGLGLRKRRLTVCSGGFFRNTYWLAQAIEKARAVV